MSALDLSEYVRIINKTDETIKGRYDGKDYVFLKNEPTDVHQVVANHIFGFGQDDKSSAFIRLGWYNRFSYEDSIARLSGIEFSDVPSPAVNIATGKRKSGKAPATIPLNPGSPRISSPTPLADADVEAGEDKTSPTEALDLAKVAGEF